MGRGTQPWKQKDLARALKAAHTSGLKKPVVRVVNGSGEFLIYEGAEDEMESHDAESVSYADTWLDEKDAS